MPDPAYLSLQVESDEPVPFAKLPTNVSLILRNSASRVVYKVDAPLNRYYALCRSIGDQYGKLYETGVTLWHEFDCRNFDRRKLVKTQTRFSRDEYINSLTLSRQESYELTLTVSDPHRVNYGIRAHL